MNKKEKTKIIETDGMIIELTRKRMKSMRLRVTRPDGRIVLGVPFSVTDNEAAAFVLSKRKWLEKTVRRIRLEPQPEMLDSHITLWGESFCCAVKPGLERVFIIDRENRTVVLKRAEALSLLYKSELKDAASAYLKSYGEQTGICPSRLKIRDMKTRWGSCNIASAAITLNLRLALYPESCLEYVVLHEMAHIRFSNHQADFYEFIKAYMPDYKERIKLLKNYGTGYEG